MLWPKIILRKFCTFLFYLKSRKFKLKSPTIITSFFRMSFVDSILFKRSPNSFTSPFGGLYVRFRIMFFDFSFVISRHKDSMASQFIAKSCLVLQQNDSFTKDTHLLLCDIANTDKKNYSLIKYNLSSVIHVVIHTMFQKDK